MHPRYHSVTPNHLYVDLADVAYWSGYCLTIGYGWETPFVYIIADTLDQGLNERLDQQLLSDILSTFNAFISRRILR